MWLVASYCISFFQEKWGKIWGKKQKNANASLFLVYIFLSLFLVLYCMYFSFLSKRPKNVTLCYMNVCVLIYLWFAKMKIWSMLQVLSQENEKKKKPTKNDSLCICVIRDLGRGLGWRVQAAKKDRRQWSLEIIKGVFLGVCQSGVKKVTWCSLEYFLVPSMMSLLSLSPLILLSKLRFGLWVMQSTQTSEVPRVTDRSSVWPPYASNQTS